MWVFLLLLSLFESSTDAMNSVLFPFQSECKYLSLSPHRFRSFPSLTSQNQKLIFRRSLHYLVFLLKKLPKLSKLSSAWYHFPRSLGIRGIRVRAGRSDGGLVVLACISIVFLQTHSLHVPSRLYLQFVGDVQWLYRETTLTWRRVQILIKKFSFVQKKAECATQREQN